jgi:hypothetical protein
MLQREESSAVSNERRFVPACAGKANSFAATIQSQPQLDHKPFPNLAWTTSEQALTRVISGAVA